MNNRPTTYAKHAGRAPALAGQFDIFSSAPPKEVKRRPTMKKKPPAPPVAVAETVAPWTTIAAEAVRLRVVALPADETFTIETIRAAIEDSIPVPPRGLRTWGQVTRMCKDRGIIEATGVWQPTASSNGSPKMTYRPGKNAAVASA